MLALALILAALALAIETARRLPLLAAFRDLARTGARARRMLGYRRCLERRKELGLRALSGRMLARSLRAGGLLFLVVAPILAVLAADSAFGLGAVEALLDWRMRLVLLLLSLAYAALRFQLGRRRLQPG
jgi:hypothetical protein